ncbi:MAG TPA: lytic transglycosylase domain-containing protein [Candidatus Wallbacteria bacterium]|nr:lytic transglycosylase domain-containing protein [Candidatus Wallbacteria bacterium]
MSLDNVINRITAIEGRISHIKQRINSLSGGTDFNEKLNAAEKKLRDKMSSAKNTAGSKNVVKNKLADLPMKMPKITFDSLNNQQQGQNSQAASKNRTAEDISKTVQSRNSAEIGSIILEKSRKHEVDPFLVSAIMSVESDYDPDAVSDKGAMGLMQLMPGTADDLGVKNPFDINQNIDGGTKYIKMMLDRFSGDMKLALAAYNAGPNAVDRSGGIPDNDETRNYVVKVLENYEKLLNNEGVSKNSASPDKNAEARVEVIKNTAAMSDALFNVQKPEEEDVSLE